MLALDLQQNPEEAANTLTHGLGAIASAIGGVILVVLAARSADVWQLVGAVVYSVSLVILYCASTLFHWEQDARLKRRFEIFDHCAIFLLIAGTYTPFLMVTLRTGVGLLMLTVVWGLAVAGVIFKLVFQTRFRIASTLCYIAMGWLVVLVAGPLVAALSPLATALLVVGGLTYTFGTYFFAFERPYTHAIWHVFVLGGSICHFFAVATQVVAA